MANYSRSSRSSARSAGRPMTRSEAGHLGGIAPHRCRGFQCHEEGAGSSRRSSSSSGRSRSSRSRSY